MLRICISFIICMFFSILTIQAQDSLSVLKDTTVLKEVRLKSNKPLIEMQADKTVLNVQADINAASGNVLEILQKAPGISITADDVINMSGKAGVNVLIDGRSTQMSSKDLAIYLRSLPGNLVDKIELITNPSSRFDAQGNAGIINIRLKKKLIRGTNGNISIGYTQNVHYRSTAGFNINSRRNKWGFFLNCSGDNNEQHTDGLIDRKVNDNGTIKRFYNSTIDIDRNSRYNLRTGIDFYLNPKHTFGFIINTGSSRNPFNTPGFTSIGNGNSIDSSLQTSNDNLYRNNRLNGNLNYHYEDTIGNELNVDADFTRFSNSNFTSLGTSFLDKNKLQYNYTAATQGVNTAIYIYAVKADYTRRIKKLNAKLEAGLKYSEVQTENSLIANKLFNNLMQPDTGRTNFYDYNESVAAAYINFSRKKNKWEYQAGLRLEHTNINAVSESLDQQQLFQPDTSYLNFFPSMFLAYQLTQKSLFAFSYSRRINRPDYQSLNPFESIYDIYTYEKGNPYLRPQYTQNFELKYSWQYALNIAIGYNNTKDYSQIITRQIGQITTGTPNNIGTLDNAYLNISAPMPINKWWEGYLNLTGFFNHYKGMLPDGKLDQRTTGLNGYIQQRFNLGKGWSTQISSWFNASTQEAIFKTAAYGSVDFAAKKMLLKNKASLRLSVLDIFNTQRWKQVVQFANMDFSYVRKWESRGIRLQLNWNFGKNEYKTRERETNQDAERIKVK